MTLYVFLLLVLLVKNCFSVIFGNFVESQIKILRYSIKCLATVEAIAIFLKASVPWKEYLREKRNRKRHRLLRAQGTKVKQVMWNLIDYVKSAGCSILSTLKIVKGNFSDGFALIAMKSFTFALNTSVATPRMESRVLSKVNEL